MLWVIVDNQSGVEMNNIRKGCVELGREIQKLGVYSDHARNWVFLQPRYTLIVPIAITYV